MPSDDRGAIRIDYLKLHPVLSGHAAMPSAHISRRVDVVLDDSDSRLLVTHSFSPSTFTSWLCVFTFNSVACRSDKFPGREENQILVW